MLPKEREIDTLHHTYDEELGAILSDVLCEGFLARLFERFERVILLHGSVYDVFGCDDVDCLSRNKARSSMGHVVEACLARDLRYACAGRSEPPWHDCN